MDKKPLDQYFWEKFGTENSWQTQHGIDIPAWDDLSIVYKMGVQHITNSVMHEEAKKKKPMLKQNLSESIQLLINIERHKKRPKIIKESILQKLNELLEAVKKLESVEEIQSTANTEDTDK